MSCPAHGTEPQYGDLRREGQGLRLPVPRQRLRRPVYVRAGARLRRQEDRARDCRTVRPRQKPQLVKTAPCKDVILKGGDLDLTIFPLFLHHPKDGHAYFNDTNVVSRDPDTGLIDQGIYRFMYRSKTETNIDMRNDTHGARIHAKRYQQTGQRHAHRGHHRRPDAGQDRVDGQLPRRR